LEVVHVLKVNLTKSVLVPVGHVDNMGELTGILGCGTASLHLKYLGLPLGASYKAKSIWDVIVEKMERQLASWKRIYLSKGSRVTLITYFLSLFLILASVANRIEKLQRNFLWARIGDEFKYHLVSSTKVYSPISEGGLAIRNLRMFNRALLGKWLWRFGIERDGWRRTKVDSKFGCLRGGWCFHVPTGAFVVGLWKNVRKGRETFSSYTRFEMGDGTRINFWHDLWVGNMTLNATFPTLFGIAAAKDASVANNLEFLGGSN